MWNLNENGTDGEWNLWKTKRLENIMIGNRTDGKWKNWSMKQFENGTSENGTLKTGTNKWLLFTNLSDYHWISTNKGKQKGLRTINLFKAYNWLKVRCSL